MDFCPGFWDWIVHRAADGRIASIRSVYDELIIGNDELKDWAVHNSHIFLPVSDTLTQRNLAEVVAYIARQQVEVPMLVGAMDEFLRGADSWLMRAFIILCHVKKSLQRNHFIEAAFKINRQLGQCQIPALDRHCPFFLRIH
ncbi:DUF4411 family protein [Yersinia aldovae]|uniref:DUF4411 family protein n=1 Tax=Yersinia aldovae TaxID=29483 RepID=UPI00389AA41F